MTVLHAVYQNTVKINPVECYLIGQKQNFMVEQVNIQSSDRLMTQQTK